VAGLPVQNHQHHSLLKLRPAAEAEAVLVPTAETVATESPQRQREVVVLVVMAQPQLSKAQVHL
jgi:hypothetical protein